MAPRRNPEGMFKRGDIWHMDFVRYGVRFQRTTGTADLTLAKKVRDKWVKDIEEEHELGRPRIKPESFGAFADWWLTNDKPNRKSQDRYVGIVKALKERWGTRRLVHITPEMVAEYVAERTAAGKSAETIIKEMWVLRRMFKMAIRFGKAYRNPALMVDRPQAPAGRKSWLPPEKFKKLVEALADWLYPLVRFAWATGARRGEILDLKWADVDFKAGTVVFRGTKNGKDRVQYLNATARALLESLPSRPAGRFDPSACVFPVPPTKSTRINKRLTPEQEKQRLRNAYEVRIDRAWRESCLKAGLGTEDERGYIHTRFRFHDIRHQSGSDMRRAGQDLWAVQTFLGHESPTMTQRYAEIQPDEAQRISEALDRMAVPTRVPTIPEA